MKRRGFKFQQNLKKFKVFCPTISSLYHTNMDGMVNGRIQGYIFSYMDNDYTDTDWTDVQTTICLD